MFRSVQIYSESVEYGPVWFDFRKPNLPAPGPRSSLTTTARGSSRCISPARSGIDHEHITPLPRMRRLQDVQVYQELFLDGIPMLPPPLAHCSINMELTSANKLSPKIHCKQNQTVFNAHIKCLMHIYTQMNHRSAALRRGSSVPAGVSFGPCGFRKAKVPRERERGLVFPWLGV